MDCICSIIAGLVTKPSHTFETPSRPLTPVGQANRRRIGFRSSTQNCDSLNHGSPVMKGREHYKGYVIEARSRGFEPSGELENLTS